MPRKTIIADYRVCGPENCEDGICKATLMCERKVLTQYAPHELPETKASMCPGCSDCVQACPMHAVRVI